VARCGTVFPVSVVVAAAVPAAVCCWGVRLHYPVVESVEVGSVQRDLQTQRLKEKKIEIEIIAFTYRLLYILLLRII